MKAVFLLKYAMNEQEEDLLKGEEEMNKLWSAIGVATQVHFMNDTGSI